VLAAQRVTQARHPRRRKSFWQNNLQKFVQHTPCQPGRHVALLSKKKKHIIAKKDLYNKIKPCYTYLEQKPNPNGDTTMDHFMTQVQCEEGFAGCEGEQGYMDYIAALEAEGRECPDCEVSL